MQVFIFDLTNVPDEKLPMATQVLSVSEKERLGNMISVKRRREFVFGHFILRQVLTKIKNTQPVQIRVESLQTGALSLPDFSDIYASISHSFGHLCIALGDVPLGVDMEKINPRDNFEALLNQIDSLEQAQELINSNFSQQNAFYHLWTRREALYKLQSQTEAKSPILHYHQYKDFMLCVATEGLENPVWIEAPVEF